MCSACGILGGENWVDGFGNDDAPPHLRLAARRKRLRLVNLMLAGTGVRIREHGRQLVVHGPTGATRVVTDLAHVWLASDELGRRPADPLGGDSPLFCPRGGA